MKVEVRRLGIVEYGAARDLQCDLASRVSQERGFLLLLQHPPVFTLGRNADERNVLDAGGIPVVRTDRGGDVTYHGPGQLVGYPIVDVRRMGVRRFVGALEDSVIDLLERYGVRAGRRVGCGGVWAPGGKIASLGLRIRQGVSQHGFSINVALDLSPFRRINPCGTSGCAVTSLERETGCPVSLDEVSDRFRLRFAEAVPAP